MNYIKVKNLFGLKYLGNTIQALSNTLYLCEKYRKNMDYPEHPFIQKIIIDHYEGSENDLQYDNLFYFAGNGREVDFNVKHLNYNRKRLCEEYIFPNLKLPENKLDFGDDELIIHIRTGDIFAPNNPYGIMIPNPLFYYRYLCEKYKKVIVVCQDKINPIINKLSDISNVEVFESNDVMESFNVILNAKNLATSGVSTFGYAAALCSKKLKTLHATNILAEEQLNYEMLIGKVNVEVFNLNLDNYVKMHTWNGSKEQIEKTLSYTQQYLDIDFYGK